MTATYIGAPVRRKEDRRFLTGRGQFVDDVKLPSPRQAAVVGGVACGIGNARHGRGTGLTPPPGNCSPAPSWTIRRLPP